MKGPSFGLIRSNGMQLSSIDAALIRTKKEELLPRVKVGGKPLDHQHVVPRGQPVIFWLRNELQPKERFQVISGKGKTMFITQDHDANKMLEAGRIQLAHRNLETIQRTDDDFRNRKPQTAAHYERLVTSKVTLRGIISAFPVSRNSKFHRVRNSVKRPNGLKNVTSAFARCAPLDRTLAYDRKRLLDRRSNRAISRCPPRRIFGRVYRVRHKLDLRYKNLVVGIFGRGTTGGTSFRSLLST